MASAATSRDSSYEQSDACCFLLQCCCSEVSTPVFFALREIRVLDRLLDARSQGRNIGRSMPTLTTTDVERHCVPYQYCRGSYSPELEASNVRSAITFVYLSDCTSERLSDNWTFSHTFGRVVSTVARCRNYLLLLLVRICNMCAAVVAAVDTVAMVTGTWLRNILREEG